VFIPIYGSAKLKIGLGSSIGKSGAVAEAKHTTLSDLAELSHPEGRSGTSLRKALPVVTAYTRQGTCMRFDYDPQGRRSLEAFDPAGTLSTACFS